MKLSRDVETAPKLIDVSGGFDRYSGLGSRITTLVGIVPGCKGLSGGKLDGQDFRCGLFEKSMKDKGYRSHNAHDALIVACHNEYTFDSSWPVAFLYFMTQLVRLLKCCSLFDRVLCCQ
mmetsp:Transcript_5575/g.11036  ORF Transcript_5575/g.11036 Transcript_5575/m.11036 type:complete len:119 (+) Transcript_5575:1011-1367(+)